MSIRPFRVRGEKILEDEVGGGGGERGEGEDREEGRFPVLSVSLFFSSPPFPPSMQSLKPRLSI